MSTIPPDLFGSYQQYKPKNKHLSDWLLQIADKEAEPTRLRQSRKRARHDNVGTSTLRPNEYLPLVRHIAGKKPRVDVPSSFIANLRSVIRQRRSFHDWFSSIGSSDRDLISWNDRHLHFIRTLQEVASILTPLQRSSERTVASSVVKSNSTAMTKASIALGVPSQNESVQDAGAVFGEPGARQDTPDDQADAPFDEDKAFDPNAEDMAQPQKLSNKRLFAFHWLIQDLHNIRQYIKLRWDHLDRADGSEIMRVAILTNTAIDLVVRLETDFRRTFGIPDSHDFRHLFVDPSNSSLSSLQLIEDNAEFFRNDPCELIFWGHVANCFVNCKVQDKESFQSAQARKRSNRNARRAAKRREKRGNASDGLTDDPENGNGDVLPRQDTSTKALLCLPWPEDPGLKTKVHEEVGQLHAHFDVVLDFSSKTGAAASLIEDEILRRLRAAIAENLVSLSTAFAVQLHADIKVAASGVTLHHCTRESTGPPRVWQSPTYESHLRMTDFAKCWLKGKQIEGSRVPFARNYSQYVRQSPLAGSLLFFWLNLSEVKSSVDLSDVTNVIVPLLHFYNLARQTGAMEIKWPEAEGLIETHGEEHVFLGKRPVGVDECWARFRAIMGLPADAPPPRLRVEPEEKKNYLARKHSQRRGLLWKGFCPVSKLIQARLESVELDAVSFSADDVELALLGVQYGQRNILQQGNDGHLSDRAMLWSKLRRTDRLKPLELLTSLEARLVTEIEDSRFEYLLCEAQINCIVTDSARVMRAEGLGIWGWHATAEELQEDLEHRWNYELMTKVVCSALVSYCQGQESLEEVRRLERKYYMNNAAFKQEFLMAREQKARKLHIVVKEMDRWIRKQSMFGGTTRKRGGRSYLLDHRAHADETEEEQKERVLSLLPGLLEKLEMAAADTLDDSMLGAVGFIGLWASGAVTDFGQKRN